MTLWKTTPRRNGTYGSAVIESGGIERNGEGGGGTGEEEEEYTGVEFGNDGTINTVLNKQTDDRFFLGTCPAAVLLVQIKRDALSRARVIVEAPQTAKPDDPDVYVSGKR